MASRQVAGVRRGGGDPLAGVTVLERGWLSSNNVLVHAADGEPGAWLVDTSHVNHAAQTLALVRQALAGRPLAGIANTHLHSDHCGGNAALQRALGAPIAIPPGQAEAVGRWDDEALSYRATGQRMEPFLHDAVLAPGEAVRAGGRDWAVITAPGHDPHMVMLFDRAHGVLLSADALWENGFGLIFPEIAGEPGFDDQQAVLDLIARLPVKVVVPGHGRPFDNVAGALERARARLQGFRADPARHARHAVKVLVKYHLMEERQQPLPDLVTWAEGTPLLLGLWQRHPPAGLRSPAAWIEQVVGELAAGGALRVEDGLVRDA
jgi:glyoxylase-like metal-dependent hydrolase (beta-lactamase superfamily II)